MTTCPNCKQPIEKLELEALVGAIPEGHPWKCVAINCPHCNCCLGAQIDPIAIKTDTVKAQK